MSLETILAKSRDPTASPSLQCVFRMSDSMGVWNLPAVPTPAGTRADLQRSTDDVIEVGPFLLAATDIVWDTIRRRVPSVAEVYEAASKHVARIADATTAAAKKTLSTTQVRYTKARVTEETAVEDSEDEEEEEEEDEGQSEDGDDDAVFEEAED